MQNLQLSGLLQIIAKAKTITTICSEKPHWLRVTAKGQRKSRTCTLRKAAKEFFAAKTKSRRLFLSSWICSSRRLPGEGDGRFMSLISNSVRVTPDNRCDNLLLRGKHPRSHVHSLIALSVVGEEKRGEAKPRAGCPLLRA